MGAEDRDAVALFAGGKLIFPGCSHILAVAVVEEGQGRRRYGRKIIQENLVD